VTEIHSFDAAALKGLRFSGHETFACRYAWLPKAYRGLKADGRLFADEDNAMVVLGLGKNMVRALRFWVEAMGVAEFDRKARAFAPTSFGDQVFGEGGFDPFLEDPRTLWLLHWNLASRREGPLFAWRYLIGHWPLPEFTRSEALVEFQRISANHGLEHSVVTLSQHLDVFLHTYHSGRGAASGVEDSLDGPLVELGLLTTVGERRGEESRWEPVFSFRREAKPEIPSPLFDYCLRDYWDRHFSEETMTFRAAAMGPASPGQIFKLPEDDMRSRLEARGSGSRGFTYQPSAIQGMLSKKGRAPTLAEVYGAKLDA
jgi:hypothetical protein